MMTSGNAEPMPDRSAKAVITLTLLALLLVAAVPVALLAGVVVMLLGPWSPSAGSRCSAARSWPPSSPSRSRA